MAVSLEEKVRFLKSPDAYPQKSGDVEAIETHMSWVFLIRDQVFKMKKPVVLSFLDFSTLHAREMNCKAELQLNRRLAPTVYLGIVPLTVDKHGTLVLGGDGEPVEWLLEMQRLPKNRMLDQLILHNTITKQNIDDLASFLAKFYHRADHPIIDPQTYFENLTLQHQRNRKTLLHPDIIVDQKRTIRVLSGIEQAIGLLRSKIESRILSNCFVEGHGDLRPEHICLTDPIVIFDCLEFDRAYRLIDPFDELSFLDIECMVLGMPWLGAQILGRVEKLLHEKIPTDVLRFYASYRAVMRARLMLDHLLDKNVSDKSDWSGRAKNYLSIADEILFRDGYFHPQATIALEDNTLSLYSNSEEAS
jgi:aminoglycoside phosphotransferase family enzyme